jgi:iron(II)-dependent oxidoreductase
VSILSQRAFNRELFAEYMVLKETTAEIANLMTAARAATLSLFDMARESDLHESPGFGFRPIIWHLAHIGVFESYWIAQKLAGESALNARYERIFDPISTPREESKNLPSRREMEDYLCRVRERTHRVLEKINFDENDPLLRNAYVFHLVLQHEYQHQETLAYLLHLLDRTKKMQPTAEDFQAREKETKELSSDVAASEMVLVPAGAFSMGARSDSFAYDNELPMHWVEVPAFKIARVPVTNQEYAHFVDEGGYERHEWWSAEGLRARERENWTRPLYWESVVDGRGIKSWRARTMFDEDALKPQHPVMGLSWYEAEAYARFMNKRLPTESEWEKAASWNEDEKRRHRFAWGDEEPDERRANYGTRLWGTTAVGQFPDGASRYGCLDMNGNVWEWTHSQFKGFPGFKAFPYPEYSETWFDGDHRVLKGGSWATRAPILRTSFRNFFRRHFRIAFAGLRLVEDA